MKTKIKKIMKANTKTSTIDYVKASRHGEWEANKDNTPGFVTVHKIHKNTKAYTRKPKHRKGYV